MNVRIENTYFVVEVDYQGDILRAPDAPDGTPQKWLPCESCKHLEPVGINVVCFKCKTCADFDESIQKEQERLWDEAQSLLRKRKTREACKES